MDDFGIAFASASEALARLHINDRRNQEDAATQLAQFIVDLSHDSPSEEIFAKSLNEIHRQIFDLIHGTSSSERLGAILAIERIIDRNDFEDIHPNLARYANYLRVVIPNKDLGVMKEASFCLGKILAKGGSAVHEMVDFELNRIFQWLQDKSEHSQLAACFVSESILLNSCLISNAYLSTIFDALWALLRDTKSALVQESASNSIKAVFKAVRNGYDHNSLILFSQRTLSSLTEELRSSLAGTSILSSLMILGHVIDAFSDILNLENSTDLIELVLGFVGSKITSIKHASFELIPAIAAHVPLQFSRYFLDRWISILLESLKKDKDKSISLIALASTSNALNSEIIPYAMSISQCFRALINNGSRSKSEDIWIYNCISSLADACKVDFTNSAIILVPTMLQQDLSDSVVTAIVACLRNSPDAIPMVESRILTLVQHELNRGSPNRLNLAIKLISSVNLNLPILDSIVGKGLQDTMKNSRLPLDTRILAAKAIANHCKRTNRTLFIENYKSIYSSLSHMVACCVVENDANFCAAIAELLNFEDFDFIWSDSKNIPLLFSIYTSGSLTVKLSIISILKRICMKHRCTIRPHFRSTLQYLASLLNSSTITSEVVEAGKIFDTFVTIDPSLMQPYSKTFIDILMRLLENTTETLLSVSCLKALNYLMTISPEDCISSVFRLNDLLIRLIQDLASEELRFHSLRCLGTLLRHIDRDLIPTEKFVSFVQEVILLLKIEESRPVRNEALRLLGIIGALDPYKMRRREIELISSDLKEGNQSSLLEDLVAINEVGSIQEDQYPVMATSALLKILKDPSTSAHHNACIQAIVYVFRSTKVKASTFLPQVFPVLISLLNSGHVNGNIDLCLISLSQIISSVSVHIRPFVSNIINLLSQMWSNETALPAVLAVLESLVISSKGECKRELMLLIEPTLKLLKLPLIDPNNTVIIQKALKVLSAYGAQLVEHRTVLVNNLILIMENSYVPPELNLLLLKTLNSLLPELDFSENIPSLIRIIVKSMSPTDTKLKYAIFELLNTSMKWYEPAIKLHMEFLMSCAEEKKMTINFNNQSESYPETRTEKSTYHTLHGNSTMLELDLTSSDALNMVSKKLPLNESNLRKIWEGFMNCSSKEDWFDWQRRLGLEFIRESPSQSIRACSILASNYSPIIKDLFNVAFLSCWDDLSHDVQDELIGALEEAFTSQTVPGEVIQVFLNLAEFMEHEEHPLPIDITTLGSYAIKCHAYAKALYYKEIEFQSNPSTAVVESLISLNSQIQLPDAATGILTYSQETYGIVLKESWYEKLQHWEQALDAYERKWKENPEEMESLLGIFRCKHALGDWSGLNDLACTVWSNVNREIQSTIAPWAAASAWGLSKWDLMGNFIEKIPEETIDGSFFRSILAIKNESYEKFQNFVWLTRERLDAEITTMINESYSRAYRTTVRVQMLSELEEVVEYRNCTDRPERQEGIRDCWSKRLLDCQESVDVWQRMLKIRALVINPTCEQDLWIRFAGLCRRMQRPLLSRRVLLTLLGVDEHQDLAVASPPVVYALLEHYWDVGERDRALGFMKKYSKLLAHKLDQSLQAPMAEGQSLFSVEEQSQLLSRCYIRMGKWQKTICNEENSDISDDVMECFLTATSYDKFSYKAWHGWALTNFEMAAVYERQRLSEIRPRPNPYIVPAIQGFFRSIALSSGDAFQDSLRLLTLWFRYGSQPEVNAAVGDGFYTIPVDNWLLVIPQLIARIHVPSPQVRRLVHHVLSDIGRHHPQALLYPLTVASKSQSISRRTSALAILDKMKSHSARLVEQAVMVSQELIRVAITWEEMWYEALEEASKLYFGEKNVAGMLALLDPLHQLIEKNRETQREISFYQLHGANLKRARELCQKYKKTGNEEELKEAWDLYYQVFKKINKVLPQLSVLELENCSPRLLSAKNLDIPIPGTYKAGQIPIKIASVAPVMSVIASKQRPRKLVFIGNDGQKYKFLLKGHEDLRQDERVMQLFGLVNSLLSFDKETSKRHLAIQQFSVVPLSQNTGLIGWVPHCDTLHTLIRDYRENRGILLSAEHRMMLQFAPDYDQLTELQKVEVFDHAMTNTDGLDLNRVLWKKSRNAESWLDRRTTFTRSLAVMSMVGYILGLGDRHPSNLMIDQVTGRVVHIDFGDCFEVAMNREKFPEKVPFRLTRMLVKAMEVSQIEGTFRIVAEHTMRVLRDNKDSVMAVLEAFVYDPLINWRLLTKPSMPKASQQQQLGKNYSEIVDSDATGGVFPENFSTTRRARLGTEISRLEDESINRPETLNAGALNIINRVSNKLTGRDFNLDVPLDISAQVQLLIEEALKVENLCQAYVGWCPFW